MAVGAAYRDYVADLFAPFGAIVFKRFFGGVGLYFKDRQFAFIMRDRVYLKTNEATRAAFEAEGAEPFTFKNAAGETIAIAYYELPARLHEDTDELGHWVRRAHEAALATAKSKKKTRENAPPPELPLVAPRRRKKG